MLQGMLYVARCMLQGMLHVAGHVRACCMLHVVCCRVCCNVAGHVRACCMLHVVCCALCRYVGVDDSQAVSTAGGLEQGYCLCPAEVRCTPIASISTG